MHTGDLGETVDIRRSWFVAGSETTEHPWRHAARLARDARRATPNVQGASGLGNSFDRPVSSYSQGMRARLGFATADEASPTILLLDEVHEALDHEYRAIVQERAREILAAGGIVVAAGHDHPLLEQLSTRALWLDKGSIVEDGPFDTVRRAYLAVAPEPPRPVEAFGGGGGRRSRSG